jgi:hypothetical protein
MWNEVAVLFVWCSSCRGCTDTHLFVYILTASESVYRVLVTWLVVGWVLRWEGECLYGRMTNWAYLCCACETHISLHKMHGRLTIESFHMNYTEQTNATFIFEVCVTAHRNFNRSKRTNLMQLYKRFNVDEVITLHVSGACDHRQERQVFNQQHMVFWVTCYGEVE